MVNINDAFPSKYLKAGDLKGMNVKVVIERLEFEAMRDGTTKPILYFRGKEKGVALNRTNGAAIAEDFGPETDQWIGQTIELFSMKVLFEGRMVDSIRVRAIFPPRQPQRPAQNHQAPPPQHQPPRQEFAPPVDNYPPANGYPNESSNDFNDDIPF